jgi:pimeloyl-ACP methyl ester carboxylesterase
LAESFGGGVAIQFALRHRELVERLVLVNTFARFPGRLFARAGALFSWLLPPRPTGPLLKLVRGPMLFGRDLPASEKSKFWEIVKDVPMSAMGRRIRMLAPLDLRSELPKIEVPTLVVVSPQDQMVHPKASRELAALIPSAHLIEIPTGHASLIHPKTNVLEWLKDSRNWKVKSQAEPQ